jgi:tape measure domain-containing protein
MSDEGKIVYGLAADTKGLQQDLARAKGMFNGLSQDTQKEGAKMDNMIGKIGASIGVAFSAAAAAGFAKQIANIRGEFQQLEVAFKTMLQSKSAADELMGQLIQTAATTPFDLKSVASGAKSLLAYGTSAKNVNKDLVMLGNVAAGLSIPLNDLVYLYGTTQVQGRLFAQDMRQFMGRGIPVAEELAKQFGVTKDKVTELVSEGLVGFPQIEKAFVAMTSKGGKFYNLMEEQSKTIGGQISNLGDAVDMMMNEIGRANQDTISSVITGAKTAVENYESIGKAIAILVATYGTYKAALITIAALEKIVAASKTATLYLEMNRALGALTLGHKANAVAIGVQTAAQKALNAAMAVNPYVLAATVLVGLGTAIFLLRDKTTAAERATKRYNEQQEIAIQKEQQRKAEVDKAIDTMNDQYATEGRRREAIKKLIELYPEIIAKYNTERMTLEQILQLKKDIAQEEENRATKTLKDTYDEQLEKVEKAQERLKNFKSTGSLSDSVLQQQLARAVEDAKADLEITRRNIEKDNAKNFLAGITGFTDDQLQNEITRREKLLSAIGDSDKKGRITGMGTYDKSEIANQLTQLRMEEKERKTLRTTAAQDIAKSNKEIKRLQGERSKILSQSMTPEDRETRLTEIDKAIEAEQKKIQLFNKQYDKSNKDKDKIQNQLEQNRINQVRMDEDIQYQAEQARIDAMKDGIDKELAQLALNHAKRKTEINRQREDMLSTLRENAKAEAEAKGVKFDKESIQLSTKQAAAFTSMDENEDKAYQNKQQQTKDKLLENYRNYAQQRLDIEKKFNEDIQRLTTEQGAESDAVKEAKRQMQKAIEELQKDALRESGTGLVELYLFGEGSDFMQSKIKEAMPLFEDISKLTIKELGTLKETIAEIELSPEQLETLKQAGVDVEKLAAALDKVKTKSTEAVDAKEWEKILDIANKLSGSLQKLAGALQTTEGIMGDIGSVIGGLAGSIDNVTQIFDKNATKTDIAAAGISGLADMYSIIANQIEANKQAQEEWNDKIVESAHLAAMARIEMESYKESNIFGVENPYQRAIDGAMQYAAAMNELQGSAAKLGDGQVQTGTKQEINWGNVAGGAGAGAATGAAVGTIFAGFTFGLSTLIGAGIGAIVGGIAGAVTTKTVPVLENLKDKYGEIFNPETYELNQEILNDYDKMDDATKKLIDNWEEIRGKAVEAREQMRQTFSDLAGDLGGKLSDALVEAFTNGEITGAIDKFKGAVTEVIQEIMQQKIFDAFFGKMFNQLEEEMAASFDSDNADYDIIDDILRFTEKYPAALEQYNKAMLDTQEALKQQGIDIFNASNRTASSKGIAQASQDSINELNGRMTAIQGHTYSISENMKIMLVNITVMINHLFNIDRNTSRLEKIEKTMDSVKSGIDQINTKGINIKV